MYIYIYVCVNIWYTRMSIDMVFRFAAETPFCWKKDINIYMNKDISRYRCIYMYTYVFIYVYICMYMVYPDVHRHGLPLCGRNSTPLEEWQVVRGDEHAADALELCRREPLGGGELLLDLARLGALGLWLLGLGHVQLETKHKRERVKVIHYTFTHIQYIYTHI